ncbi:hypothetical protein [Accumulibacter sp.]|uniref:hypothetical protein n=1 Tax=Accumulibacter sp. TaxID=2053492 RepID=UPI0025D58436|nr:hypothetical protein [Accumulibacter sp.]MCM8595688.1 hypothetical protein [Accumulibacter sp.]MCM8627752.1 hypothetical protein [Accumulibacter sp.]MDS4049835.1 hypothetical protein [Accumulibacter sp.]
MIGLAVNQPALATPGVRVIRHRPVLRDEESLRAARSEVREAQAKVARGHSVADCLARLREQGFVPDLIVAHSGWREAYFVKDVFPEVPLIVYAEYSYQGDDGDAFFDGEFTTPSLEARERLRLKNPHLLHALLAADRGLSPTAFQRSRHPEVLQERIVVIHDGIDSALLKPDPAAVVSLKTAGLKLTPSDEVITFVARQLEPYRGYHILMRALPELLALRPRAQVAIGGSRTAPVEEVIEHGRTGLLVDFFDAHQLALTVATALERRTEFSQLRQAAREHVVGHYDLKTRCLPAQLELVRTFADRAGSSSQAHGSLPVRRRKPAAQRRHDRGLRVHRLSVPAYGVYGSFVGGQTGFSTC